jgi:DNA-binding NarL/FixJ family response regulator
MAEPDSTAQAGGTNAPRSAPRVVVMDADDGERARTSRVLLAAGINVVAAVPNYAQAIVAVRRHRPDVIVTELYGGQALTPPLYVESLRRFVPAPLILYAADEVASDQARGWGAWAALRKDADIWSLAREVRRAHEACLLT